MLDIFLKHKYPYNFSYLISLKRNVIYLFHELGI